MPSLTFLDVSFSLSALPTGEDSIMFILCVRIGNVDVVETLPSYLGTMLGSAPRLRRRRAELVELDQQASHSGVTWGGEGGRLAH